MKFLKMLFRRSAAGPAEICHCELAGIPLVIKNGNACELCEAKDRVPMSPENVRKAFHWFDDENRRLCRELRQKDDAIAALQEQIRIRDIRASAAPSYETRIVYPKGFLPGDEGRYLDG